MYAQSHPAPGKPLSAYDIYIQENIARREALRVKPHPYTPKNEPIRIEVNEANEPVKDTALAETPAQPTTEKKRVRKKPVVNTSSNHENIAEPVKAKPDRNKGKITIPNNKPLQRHPRAGPL